MFIPFSAHALREVNKEVFLDKIEDFELCTKIVIQVIFVTMHWFAGWRLIELMLSWPEKFRRHIS